MLIVLPIVLGLLGITVLTLFPVWCVTYTNSAGLDTYELKDGKVTAVEMDKGVTTIQTTYKRSFVFGGMPKVGNEIKRVVDPKPEDLWRSGNSSGDAQWGIPWQIASGESGSPDLSRMFAESGIALFLAVVWFSLFYFLLRKKA